MIGQAILVYAIQSLSNFLLNQKMCGGMMCWCPNLDVNVELEKNLIQSCKLINIMMGGMTNKFIVI